MRALKQGDAQRFRLDELSGALTNSERYGIENGSESSAGTQYAAS